MVLSSSKCLWGKVEMLSLGDISSWHITLTFPFKSWDGWLAASVVTAHPATGQQATATAAELWSPQRITRTFFFQFIWKTFFSIQNTWIYQFPKMKHHGIIVWNKSWNHKKHSNIKILWEEIGGAGRKKQTNPCIQGEHGERSWFWNRTWGLVMRGPVDKWGVNGLCRADHTFQGSCHLSWHISHPSNSGTRCTWQHPDSSLLLVNNVLGSGPISKLAKETKLRLPQNPEIGKKEFSKITKPNTNHNESQLAK